MWLQQDGLPPAASVEERQRHLWKQLLNSEAKLQSATQELQTLRTQQSNEMKEVREFTFLSVLDEFVWFPSNSLTSGEMCEKLLNQRETLSTYVT